MSAAPGAQEKGAPSSKDAAVAPAQARREASPVEHPAEDETFHQVEGDLGGENDEGGEEEGGCSCDEEDEEDVGHVFRRDAREEDEQDEESGDEGGDERSDEEFEDEEGGESAGCGQENESAALDPDASDDSNHSAEIPSVLQAGWQLDTRYVNERVRPLLNSEHFSDVTFLVGLWPGPADRAPKEQLLRVPAHKLILMFSSPVFERMLSAAKPENDEVLVTDVEPATFLAMLRYIYREEVRAADEQLVALLAAAEKYELPGLSDRVVDLLIKTVNTENVLDLHVSTCSFGKERLMVHIDRCVQRETKCLLESEAFEHADREAISLILQQPRLNVVELELFDACLRWAKANAGRRKPRTALGDLLYQIRIPTMNASEFADRPVKSELFTQAEMIDLFSYLNAPNLPKSSFVGRFDVRVRDFNPCAQLRLAGNTNVMLKCEWASEFVESICLEATSDYYLLGFRFTSSVDAVCSRLAVMNGSQTLYLQQRIPFWKETETYKSFQFRVPLCIPAKRVCELSMQVSLSDPVKVIPQASQWKTYTVKPHNSKQPFELTCSHGQKYRADFHIDTLYLH